MDFLLSTKDYPIIATDVVASYMTIGIVSFGLKVNL